MTPMDIALELVRTGILRVTPNGEVWKDKETTSRGQVKAITPRRAESVHSNGYLNVCFQVSKRKHAVYAHRLVWMVLKGSIPPDADINHQDGDKKNNDPANLEPTTHSANLKHAYRTGLHPNRKFDAAKMRAAVAELRAHGLSYTKIGKQLGLPTSTAFRLSKSD